jgi:hypothetical protein
MRWLAPVSGHTEKFGASHGVVTPEESARWALEFMARWCGVAEFPTVKGRMVASLRRLRYRSPGSQSQPAVSGGLRPLAREVDFCR